MYFNIQSALGLSANKCDNLGCKQYHEPFFLFKFISPSANLNSINNKCTEIYFHFFMLQNEIIFF